MTSTLSNSLSVAATATYSVTPTSGSCTNGAVFTVTVTVNPVANISSQAGTACSSLGFSYTPTGTIPTGTTYAWSSPSLDPSLSGGSSGTGSSTVTSTLSNSLSVAATATYSVTPTSGSCTLGTVFTVTITVNPIATIAAQSTSTCTAVAFNYTPTGTIIPSGTTYAWSSPSGSGFTGGASGAAGNATLTGTLINTTSVAATATYSVTPASGSCTNGSAFTVSVEIDPVAAISAQATTQCSGVNFSYCLLYTSPSPRD